MAQGFERLGAALGGLTSGDQNSYAAGLNLGARTQEALQTAREKRAKNDLDTQIAAASPDDLGNMIGTLVAAGRGSDYSGATEGRLHNQEFGTRAKIAAPGATADDIQQALASLSSAPVAEPIKAVGKGGFQQVLKPSAGVQVLPGDVLAAEASQDMTPHQKDAEYREKLSPDRKANFDQVLRNQTTFQDLGGGVRGAVNVSGGVPKVTPITDVSTVAGNTAAVQSAAEGGKEQAKRTQGFINDGLSAADGRPLVTSSLELLDSVKTGGFQNAVLKAKNFLGVTGADEGELSHNLGIAVIKQLRPSFGAQFTEREGERLNNIEASFGNSADANKRLLNQTLQIIERAARRGIQAAEDSGDKFTADEIRKSMGTELAKEAPKTSASATVASSPKSAGGPPVMTPEQARKQPKGTVFQTTDGRTLVVK